MLGVAPCGEKSLSVSDAECLSLLRRSSDLSQLRSTAWIDFYLCILFGSSGFADAFCDLWIAATRWLRLCLRASGVVAFESRFWLSVWSMIAMNECCVSIGCSLQTLSCCEIMAV